MTCDQDHETSASLSQEGNPGGPGPGPTPYLQGGWESEEVPNIFSFLGRKWTQAHQISSGGCAPNWKEVCC